MSPGKGKGPGGAGQAVRPSPPRAWGSTLPASRCQLRDRAPPAQPPHPPHVGVDECKALGLDLAALGLAPAPVARRVTLPLTIYAQEEAGLPGAALQPLANATLYFFIAANSTNVAASLSGAATKLLRTTVPSAVLEGEGTMEDSAVVFRRCQHPASREPGEKPVLALALEVHPRGLGQGLAPLTAERLSAAAVEEEES